ncbi:MAG: prephenate dehydrogenase/arogenate dehydrogenase family protein [Alphaproteobacteria bacterium]
MKKIAIIGLGLIGSSIARSLKKKGTYTIVGFDNNADYIKQSQELGFCHTVGENLKQSVDGSDIVILATPVSAYINILNEIKDDLKDGCIITDVGSVKQKVINDLIDIIPSTCHFVPAHPISGTEKSGPSAGYETLFENRFTIICPTEKSNDEAVNTIKQMWIDMGSMVDVLDAKHHDEALAITSHIPHLFAYALVGTAQNVENKLLDSGEVVKYSAGGFRDATRVAGSDPTMWRDIFIANKDSIKTIVDMFVDDLNTLQGAMEKGDEEFIFNWLNKTREVRQAVIDAGQANTTDPHSEEDFISLSPYNQD